MREKIIKCYLCGGEAKETDAPDTSRDVVVGCPECGKYRLTKQARKFYFDRPEGEEILNDDHKAKLAKYVRDNYDQEKDMPVWISINVIKAVTGVVSVHEL